MLSKQDVIDLWCKYPDNKNVPTKYKYLFNENGFKRLVEGTFLTREEQEQVIKYTYSMYGSSSLNDDFVKGFIWDESHWKQILKYCISCYIIQHKCNFDKLNTALAIVELLDVHSDDIEHIEDPEYKRFYNGTKYGYFNFPLVIDIARHFNFDISKYLETRTGFQQEEDVPKFDMNDWPKKFKNSKQITSLKNSVTDGKMLDANKFPTYCDGTFDHYKISDEYYPFAEDMWKIHKVIGKFVPLRKIDNGSGFIEKLIPEYGWLAGFLMCDETPVYKINTVQGFSFYILGSNWYGGVYIDDISIKKIYFGNRKPVNDNIDDEKRIFIIYNEETGYWRLPELNYPKIYKNFVKDVIKSNKDKIGKWNKTHVFASSRTLNSFNYLGDDMYPEIKTKGTFISTIVNNAASQALQQLKLNDRLKSLGLKIEVKFDSDNFDFDNIVKPIDLTQEEINKYCGKNNNTINKDIFEITKY